LINLEIKSISIITPMEPKTIVGINPDTTAAQPVILLNPGLGDSFLTITRIPVAAKRNGVTTPIMDKKIDSSGDLSPSSNNPKNIITNPIPPGAKVGIDRCCFFSFGFSISVPFSIYSSLFHIIPPGFGMNHRFQNVLAIDQILINALHEDTGVIRG
jgi:hypothetical protein